MTNIEFDRKVEHIKSLLLQMEMNYNVEVFAIALQAFGTNALYAYEDDHELLDNLACCIVALNHMIYEHYEDNKKLARIYDKEWRRLDNWCCDNLNSKELRYYLDITD